MTQFQRKDRIHIGIDFGVTECKVSCALGPTGVSLNRSKDQHSNFLATRVEGLHFNGRRQVKTQALWNRDTHRFIFGYEVDEYLDSERTGVHRGECIRMIKLGLDVSEETLPIRREQQQQLSAIQTYDPRGVSTDGRPFSIEDVIFGFFEWLFNKIEHQLLHTGRGLAKDTKLIEDHEVSCTMCVPAQFSPEARTTLESIARKAGSNLGLNLDDSDGQDYKILRFNIASEPEAAAAYDMQKLLEAEVPSGSRGKEGLAAFHQVSWPSEAFGVAEGGNGTPPEPLVVLCRQQSRLRSNMGQSMFMNGIFPVRLGGQSSSHYTMPFSSMR